MYFQNQKHKSNECLMYFFFANQKHRGFQAVLQAIKTITKSSSLGQFSPHSFDNYLDSVTLDKYYKILGMLSATQLTINNRSENSLMGKAAN